MKSYVYRSGFAYFPAYTSDSEAMLKYKEGEIIEIEHKKARNYQNHKRMFALLKLGFENQDRYDSPDWFREVILIKAGHFESAQDFEGRWMYRAKSISYAAADEIEFCEVYKKVSQAIIDYCGITEKQLNDNLKLFF